MRRSWKRFLAGVLTAAMLLTALPAQALAAVGALTGNSAVENAALLQALQDAYGQDAETYLALLESYGLLDEDGNLVTDEKLTVDGVEYTLDEIEALLDDPATDLDRVAEVDGDHITLENLKKIIEIERYLAYVQATYFTKQDLTGAQTDSFFDLADAWSRGQVDFAGAGGSPSGANHNVRVLVEAPQAATGDTYTFQVYLNGSQADSHPVAFSWRALSGSMPVTGGEENVTLKPGETLTLTAQIHADDLLMRDDGAFYLQLYDLKNALFENGADRWEQTVTVAVDNLGTYAKKATKEISFTVPDGYVRYTWDSLLAEAVKARDPKGYSDPGSAARFFFYEMTDAEITMQPGIEPGTTLAGQYANGHLFATEDPKNQKLFATTATRFRLTFEGLGIDRYPARLAAENYEASISVQDVSLSVDGWSSDFEKRQKWLPSGYYAGHSEYFQGDLTGIVADNTTFDKDGVGALDMYFQSELTSKLGYQTFYHDYYAEPGTTMGEPGEREMDAVVDLPITAPLDNSYEVVLYVKPGAWANLVDTFHVYMPSFTFPITIQVREVTKDLTAVVSAPAGTYYPGQTVPVTVEFRKDMPEGETIPYPMQITKDMTLRVNDEELEPVEEGMTSSRITYLYTVKDSDNAELTVSDAQLNGMGANLREIAVDATGFSNGLSQTIAGVSLDTPERKAAFASITGEMGTDPVTGKPRLVLTARLADDPDLTLWVENELLGNNNVLNSLKATVDGETFVPFSAPAGDEGGLTALTAVLPMEFNTSPTPLSGEAELYLDDALWFGKTFSYTVESTVGVPKEDMKPALTVTPGGEGAEKTYSPGAAVPTVFIQKEETLSLSFQLSGSGYTWGDTTKVTYFEQDGTLADPTAHFAWRSSDLTVARISVAEDGAAAVIPTGMGGTVSFTLVALNGALPDAETGAITVPFAVGQEPFLMIPASGKTVPIREGQDAVVNWSSNLCQKNETAGEGGDFVPTTFQVSLYSGSVGESQPIQTWEVTTDRDRRILSSFAVPWAGALETLYEQGSRSATVTVSAMYNGIQYGTYYDAEQGVWIQNATAAIRMTSQPAAVALAEPAGGLYQTDNGTGKTIELTWNLTHLDTTAEGGGQFELYVASTNKRFGENGVLSVTGPEAGNRRAYTLDIPAVELTGDPTSYRDAYTITVKAKNAAESTWSYSSYVLYVYSAQALQILLDGAEAGGSHAMSNVDRIAQLWDEGGSEAIVALQRDIALKNVISINYGEFAWAELADQIAWKSADSGVASVNHQQGTLYENIELFSYTSYRPSTDFILSGLKDGRTTITATHVRTGIQDSVTVDVETLRDKLYLFQCYPKVETTLTYEVYTDASRTKAEPMTLTTNAEGEAAIYAPHGIAGNVYCQSATTEGDEELTWLGTIYHDSLVSSEADSTKLQLYPVNTLQLRRAAFADLYLKNPDGTPYTGQVTFRGGVYRQGELCGMEKVYFGLQDKKPNSQEGKPGNVDQTVALDKDGHLRVTMDLGQFLTDSRDYPVEAGEKLYYLFELKYGDGTSAAYYPMLVRVDATLNTTDVISSGDSIQVWEAAGEQLPFIAAQTLQYADTATASKASIRRSTGSVGPSTTFPNAWITTSVLWWGEDAAGEASAVILRDTTGKTLPGQTSRIVDYPFSDEVYTENVLHLDEGTMKEWGVACYEKRNVETVLRTDGAADSRTIPLPFQIVNMIGAQKAEDSGVLTESMNQIMAGLNGADANDPANQSPMGQGDAMIGMGMSLMKGDAKYRDDSPIAVRLSATSDPTVFRAFFAMNMGNMGSDDNVTGVYPDYGDSENMSFAQLGGGSDLDALPNPINAVKMAKGTYMDAVRQDGADAAAGKGVRGFNFDVGGYFEADIAYNTKTNRWECRPISGGFHAGGGLNYSWFVNMFVGPVPVTMSLTLGGSVEVSMDMQRGHYYVLNDAGVRSQLTQQELDGAYRASDAGKADYESRVAPYIADSAMGSDYLVALRVFLYIHVFAGIGFDYSVIAFKIGVFGQLNVDLNFNWLRRDYLMADNHMSAVGVPSTRHQWVLSGQQPRLSGSTGIQFVFKFLFISYEKIFCSVGFSVAESYGRWEDIADIWAANKTINDKPVQRLRAADGTTLYAVDLGPQLEGRDYVDIAPQQWADGPGISLFSLHEPEDSLLAEALQTGAYSHANPVLSDDGAVMLYLSDRGAGAYADPMDITNTRVAVSTKDGSGRFQQGSRFDDGAVPAGYGDSSAKLTGGSGGYAAAWVRQMENIIPEDVANGGVLTEGQQMLQMNSTEIVAATSGDGKNWTLTRLTDNSTPDLAPVVAANGSRTVVAWREVNSTGAETLTDFDQQDAIRYRVHDGADWGETQTLYDGTDTGASVKGLEAAMLSDGSAAVVYTLDTGADPTGSTDWETVVAVIPAGTGSEDTVRTFQLTSDSDLDENPQIAAVTVGGAEKFVMAWHTQRTVSADGNTESDIRLAAMDRDGVLDETLPESLGKATQGTGETVGANFRFAKNAESIEDLSILWVDTVAGEASDAAGYGDLGAAVADGIQNTGHDVLKAVKLVEADGSYTLSGAVEVAEMEADTLIDHFDAYVSDADNDRLQSVILGTNYSRTMEKEVTISDGVTDQPARIPVAAPVTGMYTADAAFTNQFTLPAVSLEYQNLYPNSDIDVQFTIRNTGKSPITRLEIVSGIETVYSSGDTPLNLLPNRDLTVTARFPTGAAIENADYTVKAGFEDRSSAELSDTLYLDIPDVGISKVETVKEADGVRTLRYSLHNKLSARLADPADGWRVRVGFYADEGCTTPVKDADGQELVTTISDQAALKLIDAGGYSGEVTIPVEPYTDESGELPAGGMQVYIKAWIEQPRPGVRTRSAAIPHGVVSDPITSNDLTSRTMDNRALRLGEDVTLTSAVDNSGETTRVTVSVQYNKLTGTASGNLIVTLLDVDGKPIEKLQSYTKEGGLLSLSKEGTASQTFTFTKQGSSVKVEFSDLILGSSSVELDHISIGGHRAELDGGTDTYTVRAIGLTGGILEIAPKDPANAEITLNGQPYDVNQSHTVTLPYGTTTWSITVSNGDAEPAAYTLVLENADPNASAGGGSVSYAVTVPEDIAHGTVTVSPKNAWSGQTVTITARPEEGYQVGKVTVTDKNGGAITVTDTGGGRYTFTMPNSGVRVDVSFVPAEQWVNPFTDVPEDAWYYDGVKYASQHGLMEGTGGSLFRPDMTTTRGMLTTVLYRMDGAPGMEDEIWGYPFADVDANAWYATAVYWARMRDIVTGYSGERFGPNDTITREQMAAILYRYAQYKGYDTTARADLSQYADADQAGAWAADALRWACAEGLISGTGAATLSPKGSATRAQVAVILTRFCQNIPR